MSRREGGRLFGGQLLGSASGAGGSSTPLAQAGGRGDWGRAAAGAWCSACSVGGSRPPDCYRLQRVLVWWGCQPRSGERTVWGVLINGLMMSLWVGGSRADTQCIPCFLLQIKKTATGGFPRPHRLEKR